MDLLTIGHSTRTLEEFVALLRENGVQGVADVRTVPRSRRNPQFNRESLGESLAREGIEYRHFPELGGLRRPRADSVNGGWRNAAFRGFADYMQSEEFELGVGELMAWAEGRRVAVMCAESVPWRCHRSLIADALAARGVAVEHIMGEGKRRPHEMTSFARVEGTKVSYPLPMGL